MIADLIPILTSLWFFGTVAFIVWAVVNSRRRQTHAKIVSEFNSRLLDRIGSFKDFSDFLQTDGGARFMESLTTERGTIGPRSSIMRTVQVGIVLVALALGLLALARHFLFATAIGDWNAALNREFFTVVGVIALSLGLGFLCAAGISVGMAKKLGVLDRREGPGDARPMR
jgi:hypothetical protein